MNPQPEIDELARRRRALSTDYQDLMDAKLSSRARSNAASAVTAKCLRTVRRQFLSHYFLSPPRWRIWIRQLNRNRSLPDFCIIGPAKSGTSDLAVTVMSHPNVINPLVKEFHFKDPTAWGLYYPTRNVVRRHALRHGTALCALVSPCLHFLHIATRLSALRPDMKVVINLRNPTDLVYSEWKWLVLGTDAELVSAVPFLSTFSQFVDKALEIFPEVPAPLWTTLHCGIYTASVAHWLSCFGHQNVRVFDVADYFASRDIYFANLQRFLGLPLIALPPQMPVTNRNPLAEMNPNPATTAKLRAFFDSHNRRLFDVIGTVFPW